jgi:peptidoglycan/xylan/chitin deacetylase (PgdA/CDA1 family)
MEALRRSGFQGVRLGDLLGAWEGRGTLPGRPVVLTFDDGFRNFLDHAAPVLKRLGFTATVFAVAGYCGGENNWPGQPPGIPRLPLLSLSDLRELDAAGFEVGAHGVTHAPLARLPRQEAEREIVGARDILQEGLGRPVSVFAYPYGLADPAARDAVAAHYRGACGVRLGTARPGDDRWRLPRVEMYYLRNRPAVHFVSTPLGRGYLRFRAVGRACRAALGAAGGRPLGKPGRRP